MVNQYDDQYDDPYAYGQTPMNPPATPPEWNQWGIPPNSGNPAGYQDLSYWISRGVNPDQIFNSAGQTQDGWARTGRGYEQTGASTPVVVGGPADDQSRGLTGGYWLNGQWVNGSPSGGSGGGGGNPYTTSWGGSDSGPDYSQMLPYPTYQPAPAFQFDPYTASSWADAENEPGYRASREQLRKQIEAGAAYRGMVRSGMTIGDIYSNLDALSQQNFKAYDDRRFRNWSGNLGLAKTKHDYAVSDIDRANNYRWNSADASFKQALDAWKTKVGSLTQLARPID